MKCYTPQEILCWTKANSMSQDCDPCKFNNMLSMAYTYFSWFDFLRDHIDFVWSKDCNDWVTMEATTPNGNCISKIMGIYVVLDTSCDTFSSCWIPQKCTFCPDTVYKLPHRRVSKRYQAGDFTLDWDRILAQIGPDIKKGWIEYSKWPKKIESYDDEICLTEEELMAIQLMANMVDAENDGNVELASYFEQRLYNRRTRIAETERLYPAMANFWVWVWAVENRR